jgi:prepilin-type N-terminal cleavage/methylation domain-containing protein
MRHPKKGFTLVEVMVTAGILALIIVGLLRSYISFSVLSNTAQNLSRALAKGQSKLEEMRGHDFGTLIASYSSSGTPGNTFALTKASDGVDGMGVIYIDSTNPNLYQVQIVVCWRNKDGRIVGGDNGGGVPSNALNGTLDSGETGSGGMISSPVTLVSLIANRG